ncbi:hypothetical protein EI94DRAFT_1832118 [Lactarius quietus]|nr:hypothetical protein EI94DRAFT_1832118 [Lactarius quietus]
MQSKLNTIKYKYRAQPLPVYTMEDIFIEPLAVIDAIAGTLIQMQFELVHYHINKRGHDSFNGTIAQITIIQPGAPPPTLSLKRKNVRDGPLRPNLLLLARKENSGDGQPVASTSCVNGNTTAQREETNTTGETTAMPSGEHGGALPANTDSSNTQQSELRSFFSSHANLRTLTPIHYSARQNRLGDHRWQGCLPRNEDAFYTVGSQ